MCCRARTPKNFQVRANMMIKKKYVKKFVATTKGNNPHFFTFVVFLLLLVIATKKCCQNVIQQKRKIFCLENFSQKFFPTSLVTLVTGGVMPTPPMYLHHIWKIFWSQTEKSPKNYPFVKIFSVKVFEKSVKAEMFQNVWKKS